ncbi:unnamed protein product [Musa textilis]
MDSPYYQKRWKSSRREGFNLQHHRMWQAADKSAQNLHRYSSMLLHDCSDRLVRVLFCASRICFNFHYPQHGSQCSQDHRPSS